MSPIDKVVEAESFVLKDGQGNIRAELSLRSGFPGLIMYDENKKRRAELSVGASGVGLLFFDESGLCRLQACLERDRPGIATPAISVAGQRGQGGIVLYVGPDALTGITFLDREHKPCLDFTNAFRFDPGVGEPRAGGPS
ncbi:MAG TPA: hypothetical protein VG013_30125 [Gemmataceae bacterium]|jgi:hypothetical protein|nr:hypothetical protein [Gemmataceae bacterium]